MKPRSNALHTARMEGLKTYLSEKPCPLGHLSERRTSDRSCLECRRIKAIEKYRYDPEAYLEKQRKWQRANKDKVSVASKRWKTENSERNSETTKQRRVADAERIADVRRAYYENNKDSNREHGRKWCSENPERVAYHSGLRRALERSAAPAWLSDADLDEIQRIYAERNRMTKLTGVQHHVDHIVPLKGKNVCGLHVPWNLQVLSASENIRKKNKLIQELAIAA